MLVDLPPHHGLPSTATLKLFDRRFCGPGSDQLERPWTPEVEDSYRRLWLEIHDGRGPMRRVHDFSDFLDDDVDLSQFDDWDIEMYRWTRLRDIFLAETAAYRHLKPLWGRGVPFFYGTVELACAAGRPNAHESLNSVSGIVLGYIDGQSLDRAPEPDCSAPPTEEDQARGHRALGILRRAHALGVTHHDISWQNVVRKTDGEYAIIDWGLATVRGSRSYDEWMAVCASACDIQRLRNVLEERGRYDQSPMYLAEPGKKWGFDAVNSAARSVRCPRRREAWYMQVPCPEPGYKVVRFPGHGPYRWEFEEYRVRPGVRTREMYNGRFVSDIFDFDIS